MNSQTMMITIRSFFFSGRLRKGKPRPDPDAKIGYCAAKKLAFVGYRTTIICTGEHMAILDFLTTPANRHDSSALPPMLFSMEENHILKKIKDFYGDNAYYSVSNRQWLTYFEKNCQFHSKDETGKKPKNVRSARRKSRIRSKVETVFGILTENYSFGRSNVCGLSNVIKETAIVYSAWNFFILMSFFVDRFEDRISLKKLLYEN